MYIGAVEGSVGDEKLTLMSVHDSHLCLNKSM